MNIKDQSIEALAVEIRVQLAKKGLSVSGFADEYGKTRQWVSALINPNQLKNRQLDALKKLDEIPDL